ncbi:hypothetical protein DFH09DRAFT_1087472 [Mycena vulgaris]|nr:hypothetical protein DFH09DRAFT_1087472 [Mycena vulgaris]
MCESSWLSHLRIEPAGIRGVYARMPGQQRGIDLQKTRNATGENDRRERDDSEVSQIFLKRSKWWIIGNGAHRRRVTSLEHANGCAPRAAIASERNTYIGFVLHLKSGHVPTVNQSQEMRRENAARMVETDRSRKAPNSRSESHGRVGFILRIYENSIENGHRERDTHSVRKLQYLGCSRSESHGRVGAVLRKMHDKDDTPSLGSTARIRPESGKAIHPTLKTGYGYLKKDSQSEKRPNRAEGGKKSRGIVEIVQEQPRETRCKFESGVSQEISTRIGTKYRTSDSQSQVGLLAELPNLAHPLHRGWCAFDRSEQEQMERDGWGPWRGGSGDSSGFHIDVDSEREGTEAVSAAGGAGAPRGDGDRLDPRARGRDGTAVEALPAVDDGLGAGWTGAARVRGAHICLAWRGEARELGGEASAPGSRKAQRARLRREPLTRMGRGAQRRGEDPMPTPVALGLVVLRRFVPAQDREKKEKAQRCGLALPGQFVRKNGPPSSATSTSAEGEKLTRKRIFTPAPRHGHADTPGIQERDGAASMPMAL